MNNSLKLLIVTTQLGNDGAERVLSLLSNAWTDMGVDVSIIQISCNDHKESYKVNSRIKVINLDVNVKNRHIRRAIVIKNLIAFFNQNKDATVLSFINRAILTTALCRPFVSNRIVFSERNDPRRSPVAWFTRWMRDEAYCAADACVFQTHEAMSLFPKRAQKKGTVIINPINPNLPAFWEGQRRNVIVSAGRLTEQKNFPLLIQAFAEFRLLFQDYKLEIYGQGEDESALKELVASMNLEESVRFCGFAPDLHQRIVDAAMYVSSSDYEGIPNSVLEAMAMGLPTISTDCPVGGPREIIKGENGILVPTGDKEALCAAMVKVARDKDYALMLSKNARQIQERYPIGVIAKEWLAVLFPNK